MTTTQRRRMIKAHGFVAALLFGLALIAGSAAPVSAHPLGAATINHAISLTVGPSHIAIDLVVDLAEIPTAQRRSELDPDADGTRTETELQAFAKADCTHRLGQIDLAVDGATAATRLVASNSTESPGDAGLATLRTECSFAVDHELDDERREHLVTVANRADAGRSGWRELTATSRGGVELRTELPALSPSDTLRNYPESDPTGPGVTNGEVVFWIDERSGVGWGEGSRGDDSPAEVAAGAAERSTDPLTGLLAQAGNGPSALLLSLIVAAAIGAAHGLAPGHGKTVIAAYLVGTRGSRPQAAGLAIAVASSHTLGVFILGAITLAASNTFAPDALYPWLRATSALIILGIGVALLYRAAIDRAHRVGHATNDHSHHRDARDANHDGHDANHDNHDGPDRDARHHGPEAHHHDAHTRDAHGHDSHHHGPEAHHHDAHTRDAHHHGPEVHDHDAHDHDHGDHHHDHDAHGHAHGDHHHDHGDHSDHGYDAASGGDHHHHSHHDHRAHGHEHGDHGHEHGDHSDHSDHGHDAGSGGDHHHHGHHHGSGFHVHGIIPHRHRTDWSSLDTNQALGWRTLAGLGLAGGLVPSTSAVLVLLGAVQIGRLDLGAALVMAFGAGMSIALVSVGLGLVTVAQATGRRVDLRELSARWQGILTPAAALVIVGIGLFLSSRALQELL